MANRLRARTCQLQILLAAMLLVSNIVCLAYPSNAAYLHTGPKWTRYSHPNVRHWKAAYSADQRRSASLFSSNGDDSDGWNLFKLRPSERSINEPPSSYNSQYQQYRRNGKEGNKSPYITPEMERQVMASARSSIDDNTVSRAISSLVAEDDGRSSISGQTFGTSANNNRKRNSLRDLAGSIQSSTSTPNQELRRTEEDDSNMNSWDTQQIALASGVTTLILSPIVIPIIHSLIPPLIPFPASISFEGAAFLGALAYILALGDPTDQSNVISQTASGGMLGDGVEVTGAVSRIVGRTALQSVQTSAPRLKAVARAVVDYDSTVNTMEEMKEMQYQLSRRLLELESENESLKQEVALWNAVEDVSSAYKLEDLKEIARVNGVRGYSGDGKAALLRRLVKERALNIDLGPYYRASDEIS